MKLAAMLQDAFRSLVRKPATEVMPGAAPARLRGRLHWSPADCTGCALCVKDCPANALELIRLGDQNKRFVIVYAVDRCTFCGQCVENCRFDCLTMSHDEWSMAAPTREGFVTYFGEAGDVERLLAERSIAGDPAHEDRAEDRRDGDRP